MTYYGTITVVDHCGWIRAFPIEKAVVMIGSAPRNDIILPTEHGGGVQPFHLQLNAIVPSAVSASSDVRAEMPFQTEKKDEGPRTAGAQAPLAVPVSFRLLNLGTDPVPLISAEGGKGQLQGSQRASLKHGDTLILGGYRLTLSVYVEGISRFERSENLGLRLELAGRHLYVGKRLEGRLTIFNYHPTQGCQVNIELEGLPHACYQMEPAPFLPPLCDGSLLIHFIHGRSSPAPSPCKVKLLVTAPRYFPTEKIYLEETLEVDPVYAHHLAFEKPDAKSIPPRKN